jgi:hypothetical protein
LKRPKLPDTEDVAEIPLPDSRPDSPSLDEDSDEVGQTADHETRIALQKYPPEMQTWGYVYESSFITGVVNPAARKINIRG